MPFTIARPQNSWNDIEQLRFFQEVYDRLRFGLFAWTPPALSVPALSSTAFVLSKTGPDIISTASTGLRKGDPVIFSPPSIIPAQVSIYGFCDASDTATLVFANPTAAAITPPTGNWGLVGISI